MGYLFVTGGTGLLGAYLVRDLLAQGANLALLVRPTRKASARERVEGMIARWEQVEGRTLPRPVVVEGDLVEEDLGIDAHALDWISQHCDAVLHSAASLTFIAADPNGEPWRSNLHGTQHVLEMCRCTGIRKFHHVSTAYVCGLRTGRILESDLDVGQVHGNDYEVSKFRAEQLVRTAGYLDGPTIYRPGIILGDSETGYTSTFYGFYAPLKLMSSQLSRAAGVASTKEELAVAIGFAGQRLTEALRLTGQERKNYVPVDWVSKVMARIITNPARHGKTYHLSPPEPVSLRQTRDAMEAAFLRYTELAEETTRNETEWLNFEKYFVDGMKVYESYWRDDPIFDTTNTIAAASDIPCPAMDAPFFMRMCRFAIESNFGKRADRLSRKPAFDVHRQLERWMTGGGLDKGARPAYVGLRVDGSGGGQWELALANGRLASIEQGLTDRCSSTFVLDSQTFESLAAESTTAREALESGRVSLNGNGIPLGTLVRVLEDAVGNSDDAIPAAVSG